MLLEPSCQGGGAAVGQQVDDAPAFEVAEDGAVAVALAPRPVVYPEHRDGRDRLGRAGTHTMQQGRAADRHADGGGVAGAGIAAERQADGAVDRPQPIGLARPRQRDTGQLFGKRPLRHTGSDGPGRAETWGVRSTPHRRDDASSCRGPAGMACRRRDKQPKTRSSGCAASHAVGQD